MKSIKEEAKFKPTLAKPVNAQSKKYESNFNKIMHNTAPNVKLKEGYVMNETDSALTEAEQSLKKKIFSLSKMEALVFSDPKLSAVYDEMSVSGEEKYGYHYNETIMNIIFNDYVLNSPKYLQKYKMAIPKEKERRDQSGINQLKKIGQEKMKKTDSTGTKLVKPKIKSTVDVDTNESTGAAGSAGAFAPALGYEKKVNEMTGTGGAGGAGDSGSNVSGSGPYVGPSVWGSGDLMKVKGKSKVKTKPMFPGGTIIQENKNYLVDPSSFENFIKILNEEDLTYQTKLGQEYKQSHTGSNNGMGVSEVPQTPEREEKKKGIDDNTSLYIGQDVDNMRDDDVKILHNDMTQKHSYFPHPDNPNLPDDGISGINQQGKEISKPFGTNKEKVDNFIIDKTNAFTSDAVKHWNNKDTGIELNTIKTGDPDKPNLNTMKKSKKIEEKAKSVSQQQLFGMAHAVQKGELSPNKVSDKVNKIAKDVSKKDVEDFASTKHDKLPEKVDEDATTMANASKMQPKEDSMSNKMDNTTMPIGMQQQSGGINEEFSLLEEINNELNAYSIHHQKLMKMSEDRKPSALVLKDRVTGENPTNFKKDLQHSGTKEIIDVEKELQWKDQQTDIGKDPQKLGQDIEGKEIKTTDAKGDESLKNVGDSANDKGDEIPKRNMTTEEQDEVNLYRNGQHSLVYDNEPGKRFEDRMKKDMGDKVYDIRQKQLKFKGKAPMYNKDPQPTEATTADKVQFDKEQTNWNERKGLKESMVTGRYLDALGKRRLIDFKLNEVKSDKKEIENLFELDFTGLGNTYNSKTIDNKVIVNEEVVKMMSENRFYTDGKIVFVVKNSVQVLNENEQKVEKPVINEQMDKMKHLLGYNPETFTNTTNIKKNRGF